MLFQSFQLSFLVSFPHFSLMCLCLQAGEFLLVTLNAAFVVLREHFSLEFCELLQFPCSVLFCPQDFGCQLSDISEGDGDSLQGLESLGAFFLLQFD